jgi:hypothetical protein
MIEVYDKAKYHYEGEYPADLPTDQALVHTGFFFGWLVAHGKTSSSFEEEFKRDIEDFLSRSITGPRLYAIAGGVLDETMLNAIGNAFTRSYFDFEKGSFVRDYQELLASSLPSFYRVADAWENYSKLSTRIDARFQAWQAQNPI